MGEEGMEEVGAGEARGVVCSRVGEHKLRSSHGSSSGAVTASISDRCRVLSEIEAPLSGAVTTSISDSSASDERMTHLRPNGGLRGEALLHSDARQSALHDHAPLNSSNKGFEMLRKMGWAGGGCGFFPCSHAASVRVYACLYPASMRVCCPAFPLRDSLRGPVL